MRSVIVCEGRDDLWFISYYLHKALKWDECDASLWCKSYNLSAKSGQKVFYMTSPDERLPGCCHDSAVPIEAPAAAPQCGLSGQRCHSAAQASLIYTTDVLFHIVFLTGCGSIRR